MAVATRVEPQTGSRLAARFDLLRERRELGLIAYVTAGDPTLDFTEKLVLHLAAAGADVVELGVPFSDPIADGPVIQRASDRALRNGVSLADVLMLAHRLRRQTDVPLVLFSYYNPVMQYGLGRFTAEAAAAGLDGVLITDLTPEEAGAYLAAARSRGLDTVFLVAPTSTPARVKRIVQVSRGFLYVISRRGVTGPRADIPDDLPAFLTRVRRHASLPLAVGFGISRPEQVSALVGLADGIVVGSALVECCERMGHSDEALAASAELVRAFKRGGRSV